jgi:hypothetical protein
MESAPIIGTVKRAALLAVISRLPQGTRNEERGTLLAVIS